MKYKIELRDSAERVTKIVHFEGSEMDMRDAVVKAAEDNNRPPHVIAFDESGDIAYELKAR